MQLLAPANRRIIRLARARTSRNHIKSSLDSVLDGRSPFLSPLLVRINVNAQQIQL
jgi:hypothetical protein